MIFKKLPKLTYAVWTGNDHSEASSDEERYSTSLRSRLPHFVIHTIVRIGALQDTSASLCRVSQNTNNFSGTTLDGYVGTEILTTALLIIPP
jgi:hypothetical protein